MTVKILRWKSGSSVSVLQMLWKLHITFINFTKRLSILFIYRYVKTSSYILRNANRRLLSHYLSWFSVVYKNNLWGTIRFASLARHNFSFKLSITSNIYLLLIQINFLFNTFLQNLSPYFSFTKIKIFLFLFFFVLYFIMFLNHTFFILLISNHSHYCWKTK